MPWTVQRPLLRRREALALPVVLLFPQESWAYQGMLSSVQDIPKVKQMCAKATDILGFDILDLCLNGLGEKWHETRYGQPAMFLAGLAGLEKLRADRPEAAILFKACAGASVGEYTALCAAGVFSFEDGLALVKLRGESMQEAAQIADQLRVWIGGLEKAKVQQMCTEAAHKGGSGAICQISHEWPPKGFSCAGTTDAVKALEGLAKKAGAATGVRAGAGSGTPLMGPAYERLSTALDELLPRMSPPKATVYSTVTAESLPPGTDPKVIVDLLKKHLTSPVLWGPTVKSMIDEGITEYYDLGSGGPFKRMMHEIDREVWQTIQTVKV